VVPAARRFGLGVLPYFPLANGLLTGKFRRGQPLPAGTRLASRPGYITDDKLAKVEALTEWAERQGSTLLEVAVGALAAQPGCGSVIAGAMTPEQVKANAATADWIPSGDQLAEIDQIVPPSAPEKY
jgi:aryl-alcohol dehydrogenase-like predicted oxidoreductase